MTTGRKLAAGTIIIAAVTTYLAMAGATSSWQYYLTVDECIDLVAEDCREPTPRPRPCRHRDVAH